MTWLVLVVLLTSAQAAVCGAVCYAGGTGWSSSTVDDIICYGVFSVMILALGGVDDH